MLQAGFCAGESGKHLIVWSAQAGSRGIHLEIRYDNGSAAGSIMVDNAVEALRLLAALADATAYLGWLGTETEKSLRGIVDDERRRAGDRQAGTT